MESPKSYKIVNMKANVKYYIFIYYCAGKRKRIYNNIFAFLIRGKIKMLSTEYFHQKVCVKFSTLLTLDILDSIIFRGKKA